MALAGLFLINELERDAALGLPTRAPMCRS
jgi:hypothetical protein